MSGSETIEDSPNENDSSENVLQNQDEEFDRHPTKTSEENSPSLGELASEYPSLPSSSVKVSSQFLNQPTTPSSKAPNIDQLEESIDIDPSRQLRDHTSRSRSVDAVISSQQNPTTAFVSVLPDSDASGENLYQRNLSPFAASRHADFASPPERGTVPVNRSLSKNLKETNTPSPEKRSVETDVGSTPIKRLRKTPDSDLGKPETKTGSYRSEPDLPVHEIGLTDKTSWSNLGPSSESQNSTTEVFESRTEVKKVQDSAPVSAKETEYVSNVAQLAIETQILKSSQFRPLILNPHLPSSCHLPQRGNIIATDVLRSVLDFVKSDKKVRIDQNRLNSSNRTSSPDKEPGAQTKESSASGSRGIHERSLSDKTLTSSNSPELIQSKSHSIYNILQGKIPRSHSKASSTSCSLGKHRRSVSDGTLTSRNSTEIQAQQDQSNSLARSQSKDTIISRISEGVNRTSCVVQPRSQRKPPISASNVTSATSDPFEVLHSGRSLPSNESLTSRNDPEIQIQRNCNDLSTSETSNPLEFLHSSHFNALLRRMIETLPSNESSTSINDPKVQTQRDGNGRPLQRITSRFLSELLRDTTPYIDVSEGQASTSRYQPIITGGSSFDPSCLLASRKGAAMAGRQINSPHKVVEGETSTVKQEPLTTDGSSSDDQLDSTDDPISSDVSQSGEDLESTHRTIESNTPFLTENHPEYLLQARQNLLSVLKEIMLHNKEDTLWNIFQASFFRISELHTQIDGMKLIWDLVYYLIRKANNLCLTMFLFSHEITEMRTCAFYGKLTFIVLSALIFTLTVSSTRDFTGFFQIYSEFRCVCGISSDVLEDSGDTQNEASRNRVKILKAMIHRIVLGTILAFRRLLMYVGENISELSVDAYERQLSEEDKIYLRRNIDNLF